MRYLLVDDDAEIRLLVTWLLRQRGHDVVTVADGTAAATALRAAAVDVLIMDVQLDGANGVDVARTLLAMSEPAPLLVFLSGTTGEDQLARMHALRPAGVIAKPFDPERLTALLDECTAGAR